MRVDHTRSSEIDRLRSLRSTEGENAAGGTSRTSQPVRDEAARNSSAGLVSLALQLADDGQQVEQLRKAIESGSYALDLGSVGRAMLRRDRIVD